MSKINLSVWNVEDENFWNSTGKKIFGFQFLHYCSLLRFGLCGVLSLQN